MNREATKGGNDRNYLEAVQKQNEERRETLRQLADDYENNIRQQTVVENTKKSSHMFFKPPISEKVDAVQVDLDLLLPPQKSSSSRMLSFPVCLESQTSGCSSVAQPSNATQAKILLEKYANEIVESYNDLQQTQSVLEMVLKRECKKLDTKRYFIAQQEDLKVALSEEIQNIQERNNNNKNKKKEQQTTTNSKLTVLQQQERDNQWIRQELAYVATKFGGNNKEETSSKRKRQHDATDNQKSDKKQRTIDRGNQAGITRVSSAHGGSWSLDQLILDLMNRLLKDPVDPYLYLSRSEGHSSSDNVVNHVNYDQEVLTICRQCSVIETHPENERLCRLTDYRN